ncbi:hypothetical protein [Mycobacteroides abscessus]|uniref:Hemerythrin HHE cation binding domain-containing protein n=1 Tax=Mycobacteroides abscessus subsp. massiliense TaxID=1962118 RepID=A0A1T8VJD2_9MYCO|nr:hypothetical protein MMCCUG48898_2443 [Mycobacteroides abscessus subsp. massiliense CCUG 48898 = JCM 15300]SKE98714.1 hemerythrin HHE cation binding domain-containing protein [Mycobacteroides abscessus subsp. massiliense]SKH86058.1 hemerythrin HHE cation binding domain-containing protein [Mycobacteroides abscessus subsp. massiliense]SKI95610.1 hemerythrin HHE cation binding domain-containing protein [Mycobacteroides abscessus subsp. massiliense]SKK00343.1 hemerythrin HHE cation binding domai
MTGLPAPELATAGDLVEFLENQHVTIRTLFDAALSPEKGIDSGSFTRLRGLLAVHETVEAMLVHPWSRGISEAGRTVANTRLAEELALTTGLEQLEAMAVGSPEFIVGLAALRSATLEHCRLDLRARVLLRAWEIPAPLAGPVSIGARAAANRGPLRT